MQNISFKGKSNCIYISVVKGDHLNCTSKLYAGCIYANADNWYIIVYTPKKNYLEEWQFESTSLQKIWTVGE